MAIRRDALAARREALGLTQEALAQELGVELSTVGRWERGTLTPQPRRRRTLAWALQISLDELDDVLNPSPMRPDTAAATSQQFTNRREAIVDTIRLMSDAAADQVAGTPSRDSPLLGSGVRPRSAPTVRDVSRLVADVHQAYQAARYADVARLIPRVTAVLNTVVSESVTVGPDLSSVQCSLHVVGAKLATKLGDADGAWTASEQAREAAEAARDTFGRAAAAYQRTCAFLRGGHVDDAERVAVCTADSVRGVDPQSVTWRGSLTLIGAIIAARRNDVREAHRRLHDAHVLAQLLGSDGNIGWTAFGPTNVLIHRLSVAVALGDPYAVLATAEQIDITRLPVGLHGREAQFHLDSAWAHTRVGADPEAVIHLMDTERVAPELVHANPNAHRLIQELLARERRCRVPGLRGLAQRAGVAA